MCQALEDILLDLMKDQFEERARQAKLQGEQQGEQRKLLELIRKKIEKGKNIDVIADELEENVATILPLYDRVKAEFTNSPNQALV